MFQSLRQRWVAYTDILEPFLQALWCAFASLGKCSLEEVLNRGFAMWYSKMGHDFANYEATMTPVPRLVGLASGVTLEVGPGNGNQLSRFHVDRVTRVIGIEPNVFFFDALRDRLSREDRLAEIYTPLRAALEDEAILKQHGIVSNSVDTVVCMQVLCSIKEPSAAAKRFYNLLRPGGQFLFWEHCASNDTTSRRVQKIWSWAWGPLVGNCSLAVDIAEAVLSAGPWEIKELEYESEPFALMPRTWGRLVKPESE